MEQIKENNRLIAEFMGDKIQPDGEIWTDNLNGYHTNESKYHTSWDWLMPVVEKIEGLKDYMPMVSVSTKHTRIKCFSADDFRQDFEDGTKLERAYTAVVEFIKWHNTQEN